MKPFDLEKALAGHPVMLRDGQKAFIVAERPAELGGPTDHQLTGWVASGRVGGWAIGGYYAGDMGLHRYDIIGMWPVKEKRYLKVQPETGQSTMVYSSLGELDSAYDPARFSGANGWQLIEIEVEV